MHPIEEEEKYGLVFNYTACLADQEKSIQKALELFQRPNLKKEWKERSEKMLSDKIDLTAFIVWLIENYPESTIIMKKDPDYQYNFR